MLILAVVVGLAAGYILFVIINKRQKTAMGSEASIEKDRATSNVAFMKGINYILSEKQDRAIEELIRAVAVDTETVETYVALGNLFRSKGEIDRAIRIRQSIILRPNLDEKIRIQALFDLGLDYQRGGFYERAIRTFEEVIASAPRHREALFQLIRIYEETRDWENAFRTRQKLSKLTGEKASNILAHYQVELGKAHFENGRLSQAKSAYKKAVSQDAGCADAYLHLGDLHLKEGKAKKAVIAWGKVLRLAPDLSFLTFGRLALVSAQMTDLKPVETFLAENAAAEKNPLAHLVLARLLAQKGENDQALVELNLALSIDPNLIEARKELGLLLLALGRNEEAITAYRDLLGNLIGPEATFQCDNCGFESKELMWRCPQCHNWDTMMLHQHHPQLFWSRIADTKALTIVPDTQEAETPDGA